jgi:hypothetical protein
MEASNGVYLALAKKLDGSLGLKRQNAGGSREDARDRDRTGVGAVAPGVRVHFAFALIGMGFLYLIPLLQ